MSMVAGAGLTTALLGLTVFGSGNTIVRAEAQNAGTAQTVWDGAFTADQSQRGEKVAAAACASCHGDKMVGSDIGPALLGDGFLANWSGSTAKDLFEKIQQTMPADGPGTLKPQQYADLLAYIFNLNGFPTGSAEITPDQAALKLVTIKATKP
jgi:mono/diheme cytochrome c family protein